MSLVCERLTEGQILGVDRSAKMIERARARNREFVASGTAAFVTGSFEEVDLGDRRFEKVFGVHVAALWKGSGGGLDVARAVLRPGGALYVFNQAPGWERSGAEAFADRVAETLRAAGFALAEVAVDELRSGAAVCVVGRAP